MAIRTVVTRGYGNGTFNGTIALVVSRGYTLGAVAAAVTGGFPAPKKRKRRYILPNGWVVEGYDEAIAEIQRQARKALAEKREAEWKERRKAKRSKKDVGRPQGQPEPAKPSELLAARAAPKHEDAERQRRLAALNAHLRELDLVAEARRREDDDIAVLLLAA